MTQFLLVDGSYYLFYRYHAIIQWWKHAKPDKELGTPIDNEEFMDCFKRGFVSKIKEFIKKNETRGSCGYRGTGLSEEGYLENGYV